LPTKEKKRRDERELFGVKNNGYESYREAKVAFTMFMEAIKKLMHVTFCVCVCVFFKDFLYI
jgi:hypothetical protein